MYGYTSGYDQEEVFIPKGQVVAGNAIGIIVLGIWYPLVSGNVANATTFSFPVHYKLIEGGFSDKIQSPEPVPALLEQTIAAGKELEQQGCRAIVGACGYFANYQPEVAAALNVPCFLSSLMHDKLGLQRCSPTSLCWFYVRAGGLCQGKLGCRRAFVFSSPA